RAVVLRMHGCMNMGRLGDLLAEAPAVVVEAEERGNLLALAWMTSYVAAGRILQGRVAEGSELTAALADRFPGGRFPMLDVFIGLPAVIRAAVLEPATAGEAIDALWERARARGALRPLISRC